MGDYKFYGIEKLNQDNYYNWKFKIRMYLIKEDLWSVIEGETEQSESWNKKDKEAFAVISLCVDDSQLIHIRNEKTAKAAWKKLQSQHERMTLSSKVYLMRKICGMRLSEGENMEIHINKMMELFDKLRAIGCPNFSEDWQVSMILSSLPASYDGLITALEVRPDKDLSMDMVKGKLLEEYAKKNNREETTEISALKSTKTTSKFDTKSCYFCKKGGHLKRDCYKYHDWCKKDKKYVNITEANEENSDHDSEYVLMMSPNADNTNAWIVDSGASCHIARDKNLFHEIDLDACTRSICVANGNQSKSKGKGTCKIKTNSAVLSVTDVYYVPEFNSNLLSVRKITEKGYTVTFSDRECLIGKDSKIICKASIKNGLYTLNATSENAMSVGNCNKYCIHYWHRVLGHHHEEGIRKLNAQNFATSFKVVNCGNNLQCEICAQGKLARISFPKESTSRATDCFDLVHSDVCGPISPTTCSGYRYFVTFIDDYRRYCVSFKNERRSLY